MNLKMYQFERQKNKGKMPAYNGRFGTMAGVARRNGSAILQVSSPARASVSPPLRQAASTLYASGGQCVRTTK
jgi:hypothetical protein